MKNVIALFTFILFFTTLAIAQQNTAAPAYTPKKTIEEAFQFNYNDRYPRENKWDIFTILRNTYRIQGFGNVAAQAYKIPASVDYADGDNKCNINLQFELAFNKNIGGINNVTIREMLPKGMGCDITAMQRSLTHSYSAEIMKSGAQDPFKLVVQYKLTFRASGSTNNEDVTFMFDVPNGAARYKTFTSSPKVTAKI